MHMNAQRNLKSVLVFNWLKKRKPKTTQIIKA